MRESRAKQLKESAEFQATILGAIVELKTWNHDLIVERLLRELIDAYRLGYSDGIEHANSQQIIGYEHVARRIALMNEGR